MSPREIERDRQTSSFFSLLQTDKIDRLVRYRVRSDLVSVRQNFEKETARMIDHGVERGRTRPRRLRHNTVEAHAVAQGHRADLMLLLRMASEQGLMDRTDSYNESDAWSDAMRDLDDGLLDTLDELGFETQEVVTPRYLLKLPALTDNQLVQLLRMIRRADRKMRARIKELETMGLSVTDDAPDYPSLLVHTVHGVAASQADFLACMRWAQYEGVVNANSLDNRRRWADRAYRKACNRAADLIKKSFHR